MQKYVTFSDDVLLFEEISRLRWLTIIIDLTLIRGFHVLELRSLMNVYDPCSVFSAA